MNLPILGRTNVTYYPSQEGVIIYDFKGRQQYQQFFEYQEEMLYKLLMIERLLSGDPTVIPVPVKFPGAPGSDPISMYGPML